ncbi:hypothetical protein AZA_89318 [Nitrospirillum viridazoti Y2]|uniref:Uncharacterized protein n=1 Tax=Nitrospirillum amazonense TaxID=28077 RepID=A0A560J0M2_9PROT|nr:hypothetical protein [Nitrospirillum amazonense]EGY00639.1 hypothetical protein AZA_89318 [Nitrospirillum amazonense Y2]TWB64315.1 hypothetical protein FBZ92_101209 [Nitrospirillum amazonense]
MHANLSLEAQMPFPVALMSRLLVSLISAALSVSLVYGLMTASIPDPWWRQAGLRTNPGYFRGANVVDYPFCQAWSDYQGRNRMARDLGAPGVRVTEAQTRTAIRPGGEENLLVELPGTAQVVAVYCGISQDGAAMGECARYVCGDGVATFIADSMYTGSEYSGTLQSGNRILTLTLMNKRAETRRQTTVRFWVAWQDDAPPPEATAPPTVPLAVPPKATAKPFFNPT